MSNGLDVALVKDARPGVWSPEIDDGYLDIGFSESEWGSFFFDTLKAATTAYREREPIEEFDARREAAFRDSLPEYPLLSRIDQFYQDAFFTIDEIPSLRDELKRAENLPSDDDARAFLSGMLEACEAAISHEKGIFLASS